MIQAFVDRYEARKEELRAFFMEKHPEDYDSIVKAVVTILHDDADYRSISPDRIDTIDDGDYQGTLVFVIGGGGYQPHDYWYVKVGYGSCSGCDTLKSIRNYSSKPPDDEQIKDYMTLALHIVQGLHKMSEEEV